MAAVNTLCMDKTGTLTTNQLELLRIVPLARLLAEEEVREAAALVRLGLAGPGQQEPDRHPRRGRRGRGGIARSTAVQVAEPLQRRPRARGRTVSRPWPWARLKRCGTCCTRRSARRLSRPGGTCCRADCACCSLPRRKKRSLSPVPPAHSVARWRGSCCVRWRCWPSATNCGPKRARCCACSRGRVFDFKIISGDNPDTVRATVAPLAEGAEEPALQALTKQPVVTGAELEAPGPRRN